MIRAWLALLGLLALSACGQSAPEVEAAFPPTGQFVEAEGLRVHYVEAGTGPTVILIHGANGNLRDFTYSLFDRLAEEYRVIAFDRPGHGYSERPPVDGDKPLVQARVLIEAARALGVERVVVVGHSFGGAVGAAFALEAPGMTAGFASLAGAVFPWGGGGGALYAFAAGPLGGVAGAAARTYVQGARLEALVADVFFPNEVAPGYAQHIGVELALRPDTFAHNADDIDRLNDNLIPQSARYGELTMPIEILHGELDKTVGFDEHSLRLYEAVPDANLTLSPGVGHMIHHAREDLTVEAIRRLVGRAGLAQ